MSLNLNSFSKYHWNVSKFYKNTKKVIEIKKWQPWKMGPLEVGSKVFCQGTFHFLIINLGIVACYD